MMMMMGSSTTTTTTVTSASNEPILSKLDRLDHLLRNLEEIRVVGNINVNMSSPRSSSPSTPSSMEFSPRSRSIDEAIMEMERKGSMLHRLDLMEDRLLKVCTHLEQGLDQHHHHHHTTSTTHSPKAAFKQLVKSCVKPKSKKKQQQQQQLHHS